jgi:hypothetical protein
MPAIPVATIVPATTSVEVDPERIAQLVADAHRQSIQKTTDAELKSIKELKEQKIDLAKKQADQEMDLKQKKADQEMNLKKQEVNQKLVLLQKEADQKLNNEQEWHEASDPSIAALRRKKAIELRDDQNANRDRQAARDRQARETEAEIKRAANESSIKVNRAAAERELLLASKHRQDNIDTLKTSGCVFIGIGVALLAVSSNL